MNGVLIDTNAYSAYYRGEAEALALLTAPISLFISVVTLAELYGGFAAGTREAQNRATLNEFLTGGRVSTLPIDNATAERYGTIYAQLRRAGRAIPTNDLFIAASALQHDLAVFTYDSHFRHVAGLHIVRSAADIIIP